MSDSLVLLLNIFELLLVLFPFADTLQTIHVLHFHFCSVYNDIDLQLITGVKYLVGILNKIFSGIIIFSVFVKRFPHTFGFC